MLLGSRSPTAVICSPLMPSQSQFPADAASVDDTHVAIPGSTNQVGYPV